MGLSSQSIGHFVPRNDLALRNLYPLSVFERRPTLPDVVPSRFRRGAVLLTAAARGLNVRAHHAFVEVMISAVRQPMFVGVFRFGASGKGIKQSRYDDDRRQDGEGVILRPPWNSSNLCGG